MPAVACSQDNDFGIWYGAGAEKELVKNLDLGLDASVRTYDNASKIEEFFFDIGLNYKFNKYLSAAVTYRFTEFMEDDDSFHPRHKWFADLKGKLPLGDLDISARLRFQKRYKTYFEDENDRESRDVGRIRLKILYDIPSFPANPYIAAELFFPMFTESERYVEGIGQQILNRELAEKTAKRALIISIIAVVIALVSCLAAWISIFLN